MTLFKRAWLPLVLVVVTVIAGFTVSRIRTFFGSDGAIVTPKVFADDPESFDPKVVKYEVSGSGGYANINYLDLDARPQRVDGAALPWVLTLETTAPSAAPNIIAQGDGNSISCRILVDGEVKDERTATGVDALTFCFLRSA
ncbi:MmpS family transport accessory protein [Mycolicibacterium sp.]|uniref:MmpS family transport accessory protein n=1 Tax=Mycolicibacterium sp. TaxID=2320850 RepID=UPI003D0ABA04